MRMSSVYMTLSGSHSSGEATEGYPRARVDEAGMKNLSIHTRLVPAHKAETGQIWVLLCPRALEESPLFNCVPTHWPVAPCPEPHVPTLLGTTGQIMTCTSVL